MNEVHIKYRIMQYPARLSKNDVDDNIRRAFQVWSAPANLHFSVANSIEDADIKIMFVTGDHGDGKPFDNEHLTVAHALNRKYYRHIHFNDGFWSEGNSDNGVKLSRVAISMIGYVLGLPMSNNPKSMMSPFISIRDEPEVLIQEDIEVS